MVIKSEATQAFWLLSQTICSQALSVLRPMTSTRRFGARLPIGLLFVLGATRTFGAPLEATAVHFAPGKAVGDTGARRGPTVGSTPLAGQGVTAGSTPPAGQGMTVGNAVGSGRGVAGCVYGSSCCWSAATVASR